MTIKKPSETLIIIEALYNSKMAEGKCIKLCCLGREPTMLDLPQGCIDLAGFHDRLGASTNALDCTFDTIQSFSTCFITLVLHSLKDCT